MFIFNLSKAAYDFFSANPDVKEIVEKPPGKYLEDDANFIKNPNGSPALLMQLLVHAVDIEGETCLVVAEAKTRFSQVLVGLGKGELNAFINQFIAGMSDHVQEYALKTNILIEGLFEPIFDNFMEKHQFAKFFRRIDQSVQGTLTDVVNHARRKLDREGYLFETMEDVVNFNRSMNKRPRRFKCKNNNKKLEWLVPEEELLIEWLRNYTTLTEGDIIQARRKISAFNKVSFSGSMTIKPDSKVVTLDEYRSSIVH